MYWASPLLLHHFIQLLWNFVAVLANQRSISAMDKQTKKFIAYIYVCEKILVRICLRTRDFARELWEGGFVYALTAATN